MKKIYKTSEIIKKIIAVSISTAMLTVTIASCDKFTDISNLTKKPNEDTVSSEVISDDNTSSDSSEIIAESSTEIAESTTTTQKTTVTRKNATSTSRSTNATSKATSSTKQTTKQTNSTTSTTKKTTTTTTKKASEDEQYEWAKYWKGYAADYARSVGLEVTNWTDMSWDNPIRVNEAPGNADIASMIHSRLNRYKNDYGVTYVAFGLTHEYNNRWQLIVYYG